MVSLTLGFYRLDIPVAYESNTPITPDLQDQVVVSLPPNPWIHDGVVYKPNFADIQDFAPAPTPPPTPKPKQIVKAALIDTVVVTTTPIDRGTLSDGDKVGDGECVTFAKAYLGVTGTWGYGGKYLSANDPTPNIGDVVLFYGHVAVIIGMQADGGLILIESNYHLNHRVTMGRVVYIGDSNIRGYHKF